MKTKNTNQVTKIAALTALHPGHVQRRRVRCGKPNCKCARGEFHTAYYHAWDADGVRYRRYLKRADVARVTAACEAHRELQTELRQGRAEYKRTLADLRELLRMLSP